MHKESPKQLLYKIAERQQGYFTYRQALSAGYQDPNHKHQIKIGEWLKFQRGIYRLALYPLGEREELVVWSLWSRNRLGEPQGVFSHYTALDLYDLSDNMPSKLHMTVSPHFRRSSFIPSMLILHKAVLNENEIVARSGYQVTTPLRTLVDIFTENLLSEDLLEQAALEALEKGLVTATEVRKAGDLYPVQILERIESYMRQE